MTDPWKDHPATPRQAQLGFVKHARNGRLSQADVLLRMLRDARIRGVSLELPAIMAVGIAQHGARFAELRGRGFVIENELQRSGDVLFSRYWLRHDPERDAARGAE
jgi:hypothetical protein